MLKLTTHANFGIYAKSRPECRKAIVECGFKPLREGDFWDGRTIIDKHGRKSHSVSKGLAAEMRKMLAQGYWPDLLLPAAQS